MAEATQKHFKHEVPKELGITRSRINLNLSPHRASITLPKTKHVATMGLPTSFEWIFDH